MLALYCQFPTEDHLVVWDAATLRCISFILVQGVTCDKSAILGVRDLTGLRLKFRRTYRNQYKLKDTKGPSFLAGTVCHGGRIMRIVFDDGKSGGYQMDMKEVYAKGKTIQDLSFNDHCLVATVFDKVNKVASVAVTPLRHLRCMSDTGEPKGVFKFIPALTEVACFTSKPRVSFTPTKMLCAGHNTIIVCDFR